MTNPTEASVPAAQPPEAASSEPEAPETVPSRRAGRARQPDGLLAGRYRLGRRLGEGGMSTVWVARDESLDRDVAVKLIDLGDAFTKSDVDDERLARFRREARVMASLRHPNVVVVHDIGEHNGEPFLIMELLPGPDLGATLKEQGPLPVSWVVEYGAQIASALECLHGAERAIVHRDVKPANLLLDSAGVLKICDFGIAAGTDLTRYTKTGAAIGTPVYMSPEQIQGLDVGPPSDIYSFGTVIYELLTGRLPFSLGGGLDGYYMQVVAGSPATVVDHRYEIPARLAELILAMLAKAPADRPSAAAVGAALRGLGTAGANPQEGAEFLAELDKIRAKLQAGRGAEAGMRWARLAERSRTRLGPDHEVTRRVAAFGAVIGDSPAP